MNFLSNAVDNNVWLENATRRIISSSSIVDFEEPLRSALTHRREKSSRKGRSAKTTKYRACYLPAQHVFALHQAMLIGTRHKVFEPESTFRDIDDTSFEVLKKPESTMDSEQQEEQPGNFDYTEAAATAEGLGESNPNENKWNKNGFGQGKDEY